MDTANIQLVESTSCSSANIAMEAKARDIAYALTTAYPNYPWMVGIHDGGCIAVKLAINPDTNWGYTIDLCKSFSASQLSHEAVMAGGELLERLGLHRGAWNGVMPLQNCEGVPLNKRTALVAI